MAKGDDIRDKLIEFSLEVIDLCEKMPRTMTGRHVARQLLRCGTAGASNYAEARGAESAKDFVHKLGIVLKELNEAEIWIDTILRRQMASGRDVLAVQAHCKTLCRIIAASVRTANANLVGARRNPVVDS